MGKHAFNDIRKNKSKKFTPVMINNFSCERQTRFSEFVGTIVLLSYVSGYKARAVEHVCKFPFVCFSLDVV